MQVLNGELDQVTEFCSRLEIVHIFGGVHMIFPIVFNFKRLKGHWFVWSHSSTCICVQSDQNLFLSSTLNIFFIFFVCSESNIASEIMAYLERSYLIVHLFVPVGSYTFFLFEISFYALVRTTFDLNIFSFSRTAYSTRKMTSTWSMARFVLVFICLKSFYKGVVGFLAIVHTASPYVRKARLCLQRSEFRFMKIDSTTRAQKSSFILHHYSNKHLKSTQRMGHLPPKLKHALCPMSEMV